MTHPAYLLARMHPKNVRFDIGSGGIPDLTSSDIAGALGMVPAGLGRNLLCLAWWPDSRQSLEHHALNELDAIVMREWNKRESAMLDATLAIAMSRDRQSRLHAQHMYATAHGNRWPSLDEDQDGIRVRRKPYEFMAEAILTEVFKPRCCPECGGRKELVSRGRVVPCARCGAGGVIAWTNTDRALALGIKEANYRKTWDATYDWMLNHCSDALLDAGRSLSLAAA